MWAFIVAVAVVAVVTVTAYNRFIKLRYLIREASSGVEVQLKRRHDLIPNIVEVTKGYMKYEQEVFESIATIRAELDVGGRLQDTQKLENSLSLGLRSLFALAENYPDLKANQQFLHVQQTLVEIEDQLQLARRYYNGTVRNYNTAVESFPANLLAGIWGFRPASFFEIEYATERKAPDVKF
jgi:LemA protein